MRGWQDGEGDQAALKDAGLTDAEQLQAVEAAVPDILRNMLRENGVSDYTDAEFEKLKADVIEASRLGGMETGMPILNRFVESKRRKS